MNPIASWMLFAFVVVGLHQLLRRCLIPGFERAGKVIDQARADVRLGHDPDCICPDCLATAPPNPHTGRDSCHCPSCDHARWLVAAAAERAAKRRAAGTVTWGIDQTNRRTPRGVN